MELQKNLCSFLFSKKRKKSKVKLSWVVSRVCAHCSDLFLLFHHQRLLELMKTEAQKDEFIQFHCLLLLETSARDEFCFYSRRKKNEKMLYDYSFAHTQRHNRRSYAGVWEQKKKSYDWSCQEGKRRQRERLDFIIDEKFSSSWALIRCNNQFTLSFSCWRLCTHPTECVLCDDGDKRMSKEVNEMR